MIGSIIIFLVIGLISDLIARALMPGRQSMGLLATTLLGCAGSLIGGFIGSMFHRGEGVFRGINGPFKATRSHSLVVDRGSLPAELAITAETGDGLIMGLSHRTLPISSAPRASTAPSILRLSRRYPPSCPVLRGESRQ